MDTTHKIKSLTELQNEIRVGTWTVVRGSFDLLTAGLARTLAAYAEATRVAVIIASDGAFFSAAARAELLAALRSVSLVAVETTEPVTWPNIVEIDSEGKETLQEFIALVQQRQRAAVSR